MARNLSIPTLAEVIGKNLRRLRANYSMSELVYAARPYGATWSAGSISAIERGNARVTIETLSLLQLGLSRLLDRPVQLHELLGYDPNGRQGTDRLVQWTDNQILYVSDVVTWLETRDPEAIKTGVERARELLELMGKLAPVVTPGEERIAGKLGITAEQLQVWSQELWGEAIEARRDRLAGEGASPQKKGRVTGKLLDELRQRYQ